MGASQSTGGLEGAPSLEQLSFLLAERFATKCFTPLELTHFKDNFYSRALDQAGFRYWNEKILSDFLGIPDGIYTDEKGGSHDGRLDAGPVVFRMVSYLGAFPFQKTLAPSVLTFEAMVKVVVLLTERYGKVLRRGRKDRVKLLFGSLADVGRPPVRDTKEHQLSEPSDNNGEGSQGPSSHAPGFSIDEPANDDYDEEVDDDDLALAALESLDAIEVFKHDQRIDRTVYEARISVDTFRRLLMLLLVITPLRPFETVTKYTYDLSSEEQASIRHEADSIISSFSEEELRDGIGYKSFSKMVSLSLPHLFDPLTPLFEHLLFSKNLDLSRKRTGSETNPETSPTQLSNDETPTPGHPAAILLPGSFESAILTPIFFSTSTGIAIGCEVAASAHHKTSYGPGVPSSSRHHRNNSNNKQHAPIPNGAGSLIIDAGLETAQLHVSYLAGSSGTFTPAVPPILPTITHIDIYNLEIWGIIEPVSSATTGGNTNTISQQRAAWQFDAREAERRKGLNVKLGANASDSDYQNARALLEMAGIIGDQGQRSGGSV
ncbi:Restriction of telomere capping protein 5 [Talaromyces atroroseus]|uniref:Restriction of telomere capping protein 5 n=1 Tax=Talaromyces atroroseus TaxID=1441469 RepID=A0A225BEU0_TALAT|nr:Restriction of telomere capping protein 5 [Talaromyces atroroseus]OKL64567.1 Restriction of telomere capping protein 5 [Talaromyces atroroseus]